MGVIWEIPSQMKSTPFMAAKSLLISFNQILASKMLLLFVPTSANSFSILEWKRKKEKYSNIFQPWQGSPEFVGLHRLFQCFQWSQPIINNMDHFDRVQSSNSVLKAPPPYRDYMAPPASSDKKLHLPREIDDVPMHENSAAPWVSCVKTSDRASPSWNS